MRTMDKLSFKGWHKKLCEMGTGYTGAIVGSCKGGPDFQVQGACSDLKPRKKQKSIKEASGLNPEQKQLKQQLLSQYAHLQPSQMLPLPENPALYFRMDVPGSSWCQ